MATLSNSPTTIPVSRRNTLNRMLDIEKRNKLERMQSATTTPQKTLRPLMSAALHPTHVEESRSIPSHHRQQSPQSRRVEIRPPPLELFLKIPQKVPVEEVESQELDPVSADPVSADPASAIDPANDDALSVVSSICQSPSWSDYGGKKKKQKKAEAKQREKEQRRLDREKEKGMVDVSGKTTQKPKRLVKAPPVSSKRPRRSTSTPALQTVPQSPDEESGPTMFSHARPASSGANVFLGGLKLKLANQVLEDHNATHSLTRDVEVDKSKVTLNSKADVVSNWARDVPSYNSLEPEPRRMSLPAVGQPVSERSFALRMAKEAQSMENLPKVSTLPPFDFEDKNRSKSQRYSTAPHYASNVVSVPESRQDMIRAAVEADLASIRTTNSGRRSRRASTRSPDRRSMMSVDSIENPPPRETHSRPGRRSQRVLYENATNFSHPKAVHVPQLMDEPLTPPYDDNSTPAVEGSLSIASEDAPGEEIPDDEVEIDDEIDRYHAFLVESATPQGNNSSRQEATDVPPQRNGSKNKTRSASASGFKSAALAAFSRKSNVPNPSYASLEDSKNMSSTSIPITELPESSAASTTSHQPRTGFKKKRSGSKIEQILGAGAARIIPLVSNNKGSVSLSSSSMTDRSDDLDRAAANDSSNITTPTGSRPHSGQLLASHEYNENSSNFLKSTSESRSGEADIPLSSKPSSINSNASSTLNGKDFDDKINPPLLHMRSQSTPVLNDELKFLPELKHQSLVRPNAKSTPRRGVTIDAVPTQATISASQIKSNKARPSILKPSHAPESQLANRSDAPTASSADYLREARLSAPSTSQASRRLLANAHSSESHPNSNEPGEPIAKMFVICCKCKFFHDLPSKIYEAMAASNNTIVDPQLGVSGQISTIVRCPWCSHGMSTQCCAGYAAVVQLRERFH